VTAQQYAEHLADPLQDLHERLRDHRAVAPPGARVWSEQDAGPQRPLGPPCCEDTLGQRAVVMRLAAIFEPELHGVAQGVRQGPRPHQAWHALREQCRTLHLAWIVAAAVGGCVDKLAWGPRREGIHPRGREGGRLRLLGKWLHAGGLESGALRSPDQGPPPGGGLSPRGAKGFLPRVLAAWFVNDVPPRMPGRGFLRRCAEDVLIGCA
jgi:hypothetical protein